MRATLPELAILNLIGVAKEGDPEYMPTEEAWQALREDYSEDFGNDLVKWAAWVDKRFPRVGGHSLTAIVLSMSQNATKKK